jgi:hypothetical protein
MTRRTFAAAIAASAAGVGDRVVLEALYGERLPATLRISRRRLGDHPYFELRIYRGESSLHGSLEDVFKQAQLRPAALAPLRFLLPFDSLQQRARAWDRLNSDPQWVALRKHLRLCETTIYRARQPGGSIFEMSL